MKSPTALYRCLPVLLCATMASCFNPDKYDDPDPDDIVHVVSGNATGVANGKTVVVVKGTVSKNASKQKRYIVFKTTLGSFVGGKGDSLVKEAYPNFEAKAELISVEDGEAVVFAESQGIRSKDSVVVHFDKVLPSSITVTVDSFAVSSQYNRDVIITATMEGVGGGKPSVGAVVRFEVQDSSGNDVGFFLNGNNKASSDANGVAKIRYSPGGVPYRGYLFIKAFSEDNPAATPGSTRIFLY
jgi:hypothetical protein